MRQSDFPLRLKYHQSRKCDPEPYAYFVVASVISEMTKTNFTIFGANFGNVYVA